MSTRQPTATSTRILLLHDLHINAYFARRQRHRRLMRRLLVTRLRWPPTVARPIERRRSDVYFYACMHVVRMYACVQRLGCSSAAKEEVTAQVVCMHACVHACACVCVCVCDDSLVMCRTIYIRHGDMIRTVCRVWLSGMFTHATGITKVTWPYACGTMIAFNMR